MQMESERKKQTSKGRASDASERSKARKGGKANEI